ncbi:GFA family protein [Granulosicoccaceae sp. 1_MG-2023]|nr:GFA family protein [Granulosicoccaceae sp. 1_MG-2023]
MTDTHFATGRCQCGAVHYSISSPPLRMAQCHCLDCQRVTGTGHACNAFFREEDVTLHGEASEYISTADSGHEIRFYFCPTCGSRLWKRNSASPGILNIPVGGLDNKDWFKPDVVLYTRSAPAWDLTDPAVPHFEAMPTA